MRLVDGMLDAALAFGAVPIRDIEALTIFSEAAADGVDLVEIATKGSSFHQDAYVKLAGPKDENGKQTRVGTTLRCDPSNKFDCNAIDVECMGLNIAKIERADAAILSPLVQTHCGGAIEGRGLIVGGWKREESEGYFGVRVWLTSQDMKRLQRPLD